MTRVPDPERVVSVYVQFPPTVKVAPEAIETVPVPASVAPEKVLVVEVGRVTVPAMLHAPDDVVPELKVIESKALLEVRVPAMLATPDTARVALLVVQVAPEPTSNTVAVMVTPP
jgi:hypothetical protein